MSNQSEIEKLISKGESITIQSPSTHRELLAIGHHLKSFGKESVDALHSKLLAMPQKFYSLTEEQYQLCNSYLFMLEGIDSSEAFSAILDAKVYFDESKGYWDELFELIDAESYNRLEEISSAVLRGTTDEVWELVLVIFAPTSIECNKLSQQVIENLAQLFENHIEFAGSFQRHLVCMIDTHKDMRFLQYVLRLLALDDVDLCHAGIEVIAELNDAELFKYLKPLLQDEDNSIRDRINIILSNQ